MQKLIQGIHQFQREDFLPLQGLFEQLAKGQNPETLFITCSDSRIDPNLLTRSKPGDLFILRNAGNIVPPHGAANGGEAATIEYAVAALGVKDIIICGHSHCGAMQGLLQPEQVASLPAVSSWLSHAETTRRIIRDNYGYLDGERLLTATVEENVLVQLENLRTHPAVAPVWCGATCICMAGCTRSKPAKSSPMKRLPANSCRWLSTPTRPAKQPCGVEPRPSSEIAGAMKRLFR